MTRPTTDVALIAVALVAPIAAFTLARSLLGLLVLALIVPLTLSLYSSIRLAATTTRRTTTWLAFVIPAAVTAGSVVYLLARGSLVG